MPFSWHVMQVKPAEQGEQAKETECEERLCCEGIWKNWLCNRLCYLGVMYRTSSLKNGDHSTFTNNHLHHHVWPTRSVALSVSVENLQSACIFMFSGGSWARTSDLCSFNMMQLWSAAAICNSPCKYKICTLFTRMLDIGFSADIRYSYIVQLLISCTAITRYCYMHTFYTKTVTNCCGNSSLTLTPLRELSPWGYSISQTSLQKKMKFGLPHETHGTLENEVQRFSTQSPHLAIVQSNSTC